MEDFFTRSCVSKEVLTKVAEREGCDPIDLPPLHGTIDADALDRFFVDPIGAIGNVVRFTYLGYDVEIENDGQIIVTVESVQP